MTSLQVLDDLDKLMQKTEPVDVLYIFSAYSRTDLEDWLFSYSSVRNITPRMELIFTEVKQLILIS